MTFSFKRSIVIQYTLYVHAKKCFSANLVQIFCNPSSNSSSQHSQSTCWVLRNVKKIKAQEFEHVILTYMHKNSNMYWTAIHVFQIWAKASICRREQRSKTFTLHKVPKEGIHVVRPHEYFHTKPKALPLFIYLFVYCGWWKKYQLSSYSKNVCVGRIFSKSSSSEILAKGKELLRIRITHRCEFLGIIFSSEIRCQNNFRERR